MKYRAEIDGLRALAVVPVILFHAGFELFSGGFIGVDVFFVISGYLITKIVYEQSIRGEFSILSFYDRRIRRILPPLIVTACLTIVIAVTFSPADIKNVGQSFVATFTFLSNYFFYLETDYFNPFNQSAPLLHTWSLSVEEQFYILYPLTLYGLTRIGGKYLVLILAALLSFYAAVQLTEINPNLSFYSIHTRGWELLIGAIVAVYETDSKSRINLNNRFAGEILVLSATAGLMASFVLFNASVAHPSWLTLIPVLCTAVIIFFSPNTTLAKSFLGNRFFVGIGLISYALYLFHNPIFSAIKYHSAAENVLTYKVFSLPFILLCSYLSYRFIETPARHSPALKAKYFHPVLFMMASALICLGYVTHKENGFLRYFSHKLRQNGGVQLVDVRTEKVSINAFRTKLYPYDAPFDCTIDLECTNILVIGDSFSEDAFHALSSLNNPKISVRRLDFDDECMGVANLDDTLPCKGAAISFKLLQDSQIIIVTAKWQESTYRDGLLFSKLLSQHSGKPVYVSGSVMFEDLSSFSFKTQGMMDNEVKISKLVYANQRFDRLRISDKLRALVKDDKQLNWIEKSDFFCDHEQQSCRLFIDGEPLIWDNAHLTKRGYPLFGHFLLDAIFPAKPTVLGGAHIIGPWGGHAKFKI